MVAILNCALEPELCDLRSVVRMLRDCEVVSPDRLEDAICDMRNRHFDVLLLCCHLNPDTIERLCLQFRDSCPGGTIVSVECRYTQRKLACGVDYFVSAHDPEALLSIVTGTKGKLINSPSNRKSRVN